MPESVREIGVYAFSGCSGPESVTLSPNLTQIPDGAFYQCSSLGEVQVCRDGKGVHQGASSGSR